MCKENNKRNLASLVLLNWNVNQSAIISKKTLLPDYVVTIINEEVKPDIFVLTEVFDLKNENEILKEKFTNYELVYADRKAEDKKNEILIGIKKDNDITLVPNSVKYLSRYNKDMNPNFLSITVKYNNSEIVIIGVRIRAVSDDEREEQFKMVLSCLEIIPSETKIICACDLNPKCSIENYRKHIDLEEKDLKKKLPASKRWSYWWIKSKLSPRFGVITPNKGWSWVSDKNQLFINDHIITRKDMITNVGGQKVCYVWDFMNKEEAKEDYEGLKSRDFKSETNRIGIPDHAILLAKIKLE